MHKIGVQSPDGITSHGANNSLKNMPVSVKECLLTAHEANHDCVGRLVQYFMTTHVG